MRGSGKIFAVSCGPTAVASSVVSGSAIVALASRRLSERSLIALQIDFVLCCCDAQVVAAKGQRPPLRLRRHHDRCSPGRRGRYHPRPPQTRTCAIHAFGSSRESFADDVMDAFGAILCHRHSLTEGIYLVSLAIHVVSWTRFAGCMSRPLFLDMVLSSRRLPSLLRVPASLVPRSRRYYEGATTSHLRISGRLFCSLPPPT